MSLKRNRHLRARVRELEEQLGVVKAQAARLRLKVEDLEEQIDGREAQAVEDDRRHRRTTAQLRAEAEDARREREDAEDRLRRAERERRTGASWGRW